MELRKMKLQTSCMIMLITAILTCIATTSACANKNKEYDGNATTGKNLAEQAKAWANLAKAAEIIDHDEESFWAYYEADSILKTVKEKNVLEAMTKINSATTYIYYGMSYTRTVTRSSVISSHELEKLSAIINDNMQTDDYSLLRSDMRALYAAIFFYKMSNDPSASELENLYKKEEEHLSAIANSLSKDEALAASFRIKKLWFKVYAVAVNFLTGDRDKLKEYATAFDALPSTVEEVRALGETGYRKAITGSIKVQTEMINDIVNGINREAHEK